MDLPLSSTVNATATQYRHTSQQYRATAAFHQRAAAAFMLYGQRKQAQLALGLAFICRQRADRMEGAA